MEKLSHRDITVLKLFGQGPFGRKIKKVESKIDKLATALKLSCGISESDTGLAPPSTWTLTHDRQRLMTERPLQVARVTKCIPGNEDDPDEDLREPDKYLIDLTQQAKFVVKRAQHVAPTDIEEGMRVGVDRTRYHIRIALPPKINPSVTMMEVEAKPDVTYGDIGGCKDQLLKLREVVELPMLHPERFARLGIDPPKGVLLFGPPGTGKTLSARAIANRTDATFIRVIGSELVQRYVGEGARMVRELFQLARTKRACIIFFDEVDAFGGVRFDDGEGGDNEVQRTMLELINQLDGFEARGNIKVLMATNRPDTLDPALLRPGRIDRQVEFGLPDEVGRAHIFRIHCKAMNVEKKVRFDLLARLTPNSTGADIKSVCVEAGMFAVRERRKVISEKDLLKAIEKVIKGYSKFSATGQYMQYQYS
ncbi:26S proteasome regulatory subunit 7B [Aduncisulcus paluster]|uniref:26S proteasome regulatory subunit 7B n=1 Tax=Aduncisulcus paluster TaxID=2918883 RepID=A0ABQ5K1J6_9EUKA|nr:26S proteasome regulatory subunit 7B [Aduncisulcus paluster]